MEINREKESLITQESLKERLHYDKDTGIFTWTDSKLNGKRVCGKKAGNIHKASGYCLIGWTENKKYYKYFSHRLAWLYVYGEYPKLSLDHINHNKIDNRIINLREVTQRENQRNQSRYKNNTSGHTGVFYRKNKTKNKYEASIRVDRRLFHLGCFETSEDAVKAVKEAREHYGFHVNHGQTND